MKTVSTETPLMRQYNQVKQNYKNEVLFFRLGDFYEMFNTDAVEVSRLLNLTLTHRAGNPMCGIPYHAAKVYIARLLRFGKKIAICEQIGEIAHGKGLTERKVIEVITPGTAVESEYLDSGINNFLAALFVSKGYVGFSYIDVTTSEFMATSWQVANMEECFQKELIRCSPRELLLPESLSQNTIIQKILATIPSLSVSYYPDWDFSKEIAYQRLIKQFQTINLNSFALNENSPEIIPAGFLLDYVENTTHTSVPHIKSIKVYHDSEYMIIDNSSIRNLEIVSNVRDGSSQYSLLECVNFTLTAMGNRMLRSWLLSPLTDCTKINARQNNVVLFFKNNELLENVRENIAPILDIERLCGRIAMDRAHAKDLQALSSSLSSWLLVREKIAGYDISVTASDKAEEIISLIQNSILPDPSTSLTDGGIIKEGWSEELDHYRDVHSHFDKVLDKYAEEERKTTGIQNLKIRCNRSAGYYLEVTKGKLTSVPQHFIMRRSLLNAERYTTEKLQELEHELNTAGSKIVEIEKDLFIEIRTKLHEYIAYLMQISAEIAYTDVTSSFAYTAKKYNWVQPVVDQTSVFYIKQGRHPVVELHLPTGEFVPNDIYIKANDLETSDDAGEVSQSSKNIFFNKETPSSFALLTGPNMAGKSTYLRQNALIAILAQSGSFVPAVYAHIGIVDRIFCRVGASDNLARGESTFLVEMTETAHILRFATLHSLVIMDEVGRGTSTEDGLSIAWAVSEYLLFTVKCRTLFATHYHELARLENNYLLQLSMAVSESTGEVIFLRKIKSGASENSYGIHVARLAGVPQVVINRSNEILTHIQKTASDRPVIPKQNINLNQISESNKQPSKEQVSSPGLFSDEEIILDEILSTDVNNMTPVNALQLIERWKKELSGK